MAKAYPLHKSTSASLLALLLIIATGLVAYANSYGVPFVFDGKRAIVDNLHIRKLWPLWDVAYDTSRPVMYLSVAFNYALGELHPAGYHAASLAIHLLAASLLYGFIRRTLCLPQFQSGSGRTALVFALAVSLLWVVHPLQTESVTYIYQRAEALAGFFYLLVLYSMLRGATASRNASHWYTAAIVSCALGMASKPVMVTAPLLAFLYDRVFLAGTYRDAWRLRHPVYLGLFSTWALLILILAGHTSDYGGTGFDSYGLSPWLYMRSQPGVLWHYLQLILWPQPLVIDYAWRVPERLRDILLPTAGLIGIFASLAWVWRRDPRVGFLGAAFFIILAPTSSIIPIVDLAVEHRLYLALAPALSLILIAGARVLRWLLPQPRLRVATAATCVVASGLVLSYLTFLRNQDYRSEEIIWRDTVTKRPGNARAWCSLGGAVADQGRFDEAIGYFATALKIRPNYAEATYNLSIALARKKRYTEAVSGLKGTLKLWPGNTLAQHALATTLSQAGRYDEAITVFEQALANNPDDANMHYNLAVTYFLQGNRLGATRHFAKMLILTQNDAARRGEVGPMLAHVGLLDEVLSAIRSMMVEMGQGQK